MQTHTTNTPSSYAEALDGEPPPPEIGSLRSTCDVTSAARPLPRDKFKIPSELSIKPILAASVCVCVRVRGGNERVWGGEGGSFCSALTVKCQAELKTVPCRSLSACLTARGSLNICREELQANCLALIHH